ncbi:hypothetical protein KY362_02295 [Candidatus Woesearchaeota archaeon]|nr:hypothetical protein [Candidatus Woesearchaeota archaeon]
MQQRSELEGILLNRGHSRTKVLAVAIIQSFVNAGYFYQAAELLKRHQELFHDNALDVVEKAASRSVDKKQYRPLQQTLAPQLIESAFRSGHYSQALLLMDRHKEVFERADLEGGVTMAIDELMQENPRARVTDHEHLVPALLESESMMKTLEHIAPGLAATAHITTGDTVALMKLKYTQPAAVGGAYLSAGMPKKAAELAIAISHEHPSLALNILDEESLIAPRVAIINEILSRKNIGPYFYETALKYLGEPSDDGVVRFMQDRACEKIAKDALATEPWSAFLAAKRVRFQRQDVYRTARKNLIQQLGHIDYISIFEELCPNGDIDEMNDRIGLRQLAKRIYQTRGHADDYEKLPLCVKCYQLAGVGKKHRRSYEAALIALCSMKLPELDEEDSVIIGLKLVYSGDDPEELSFGKEDLTAFQLLKDYGHKEGVIDAMRLLSRRLGSRIGLLDKAVECERIIREHTGEYRPSRLELLEHRIEERERKFKYR